MKVWEVLLVPFILTVSIIITASIFYNGERVVNGQTIDCIGFFDTRSELPPGYVWRTEENPLWPSFFIAGPIGLLGVSLTDAVCPVPVDYLVPDSNVEPGTDAALVNN